MKEFNLELAKAGHPVCTRDGKPARIICFDSKTNYPIIGLITYCGNKESIVTYTEEGTVLRTNEHDLDLMMVSEKKEGWINIYNSYKNKTGRCSNFIYYTKDEALIHKCDGCVATIKIEWEE